MMASLGLTIPPVIDSGSIDLKVVAFVPLKRAATNFCGRPLGRGEGRNDKELCRKSFTQYYSTYSKGMIANALLSTLIYVSSIHLFTHGKPQNTLAMN
jgi:hypothetical protein